MDTDDVHAGGDGRGGIAMAGPVTSRDKESQANFGRAL